MYSSGSHGPGATPFGMLFVMLVSTPAELAAYSRTGHICDTVQSALICTTGSNIHQQLAHQEPQRTCGIFSELTE